MSRARPAVWDRFRAGVHRHLIGRSSLRIVRFGVGGLFNTALGYGMLLLLLHMNVPTPAALAGATLVGIAVNFQTSRHYIFQSRQSGRLVRFALVYLALLQINWVALVALRHLGLHDWSAQGLLLGPLAFLSYGAQRSIVFRPNGPPR